MKFNTGSYIRSLRESHFEKKITREKLAEILDVTASTIVRWENNEVDPKIENLKKLADYFEVPLYSFFGGPTKKEDTSKKDLEVFKLKAELWDLQKKIKTTTNQKELSKEELKFLEIYKKAKKGLMKDLALYFLSGDQSYLKHLKSKDLDSYHLARKIRNLSKSL